jgi:hypothetical protein
LSIAIIIHAILAIGGGIWVAQRILAPENKNPDFASSRGPAGDPPAVSMHGIALEPSSRMRATNRASCGDPRPEPCY